jgi:type I restriction enzyme, S subunit
MSASKWKPYPQYKKSNGPTGMLPFSWSEVRFRMLFDTQKGKIPSEIHPEALADSVPYLTLEYIRKGINPQYVVPGENLLVLNEDDLLIWWDGTAGEVLKSPFGVISSTAAHISPKYDECRDFDYYSLKTMEPIIKSGNTGMGIPHVDGVFLKELVLPRPSLDERQKISTFLNKKMVIFDDVIARWHEKLLLMEKKRSSLITQTVTKGLDSNVPMKESGIEYIGDIPAHWKIGKIKQFSTLITSGPRGWSDLINDEGDSIFLQSGDLDDSLGLCIGSANKITPPANMESKRSKISNGDIVVCITGANTGRVAVASNIHDDVYINQHLSLIKLNNEKLDSSFVGFQLKSEAGKQYFKTKQYGLKEGLSLGDVGETIVVFPELEEQKEIGKYISEQNVILDNLVSVIKSTIMKMREYRTALISAAVIGKIDIRESV